MGKVGRNDICPCGSGIKYKKCCEKKQTVNKFIMGQETSSQKIIDMIEILQERFPNHRFIDITDDLDDTNYKEYQLKNYNTNIVMIAEKKLKNSLVFIEREESSATDIIIMHRGSYRSFIYENLDRVLESLATMIK
jgi:hypothetical protein